MISDPRWDDVWLMKHCAAMKGDPESWPYTVEFEVLAANYRNTTGSLIATDREVYLRCMYLRKRRFSTKATDPKMPTFSKGERTHPDLNPKENAVLIMAYGMQPLPADRLPYSRYFDGVYATFCKHRTDLDKSQVWLAVLHLRKSNKLPPKGERAVREQRLKYSMKGFGDA